MKFSGRIIVRVTIAAGDREDHYFSMWSQAVRFMRHARRVKGPDQGRSFELFFD